MLTIDQVAVLVGLTEPEILALIVKRKFPRHLKVGRYRRWIEADIKQWVEHEPERKGHS